MAKKYTDKSRFRSKFGQHYAHDAQYITEQFCNILARHRGIDLPDKFWNIPEWKKIFRYQVVVANKLLQQFSAKAILLALRDKRMFNITSLGYAPLKRVIAEYEQKLKTQQEQSKETTTVDATEEIPKEQVGKKSILQKLGEIDDKQRVD